MDASESLLEDVRGRRFGSEAFEKSARVTVPVSCTILKFSLHSNMEISCRSMLLIRRYLSQKHRAKQNAPLDADQNSHMQNSKLNGRTHKKVSISSVLSSTLTLT